MLCEKYLIPDLKSFEKRNKPTSFGEGEAQGYLVVTGKSVKAHCFKQVNKLQLLIFLYKCYCLLDVLEMTDHRRFLKAGTLNLECPCCW